MTVPDRSSSLLSPRDLARALGVSESSVKRWVDDGALAATRTSGGHRRIQLGEAIRFVRRSGAPVVAPELLGAVRLPALRTAPVAANDEAVVEALWAALVADDQAAARGVVMGLFLGGWPIAAICDGPLRAVLTRVGELWRHDAEGILVEHRATDTCVRALSELRALLRPPASEPPRALGGALSGDPYLLPSMMAALVVADLGFEERNLGPDTPLDVLLQAVARYAPRLVWLSVSVERGAPTLARDLEQLARAVAPWGGTIAIGGRATPALPAIPGVAHVATMSELAELARGLAPPASAT
ncbi:MAG: helix-turn-helix domain-containing protein [Deltaproteobacteria bacterium]|nr:helix-turn-helix domain-containing protein [Deltaproteobacteria bacterium]